MAFIANNLVSKLAENNSGHNSELSDSAGGNTMESDHTDSVSGPDGLLYLDSGFLGSEFINI